MAKEVDYHAEGQKDYSESLKNSDFISDAWGQVFGGHYDPPSNSDDRAAYDAGWENAKNNS